MRGTDIRTSFFIILVFLAMFLASIISVGIKKFKENWPKYKCNPAAMPFAGTLGYNTMDNFVDCISSIQAGLMGRFLAPIFTMTKWITSLAGNIMANITALQSTIFNLKNVFSSMIGDITGVFVNIIVKFQKIIVKMKDLLMKFAGTTATIIYMMQGLNYSGQSIWAGPIGDVTRFLCFSPNTPIKMSNGEFKKMKDIKIGEFLENDIEVIATLKIKNNKDNPYYKIWSDKLNQYIYVTGSHKIINPDDKNVIPVEKFKDASKTNINPEVLSCLITENHHIPIGEHTFWDWED